MMLVLVAFPLAYIVAIVALIQIHDRYQRRRRAEARGFEVLPARRRWRRI